MIRRFRRWHEHRFDVRHARSHLDAAALYPVLDGGFAAAMARVSRDLPQPQRPNPSKPQRRQGR